MTESEWSSFLGDFSRESLADPAIRRALPADIVASGRLDSPPASDETMAASEARLGVRLPPSYRAFLRVTDGWLQPDPFISRLRGVADLGWFREQNQDWIDAYVHPPDEAPITVPDAKYLIYGEEQDSVWFRSEYLSSALQISEVGGEAVVLLNPRTVTPEGEWETWFFANWLPGASRYRSFREFMEAELDDLRHRRENPKPARPAGTKARSRPAPARPWWKFW